MTVWSRIPNDELPIGAEWGITWDDELPERLPEELVFVQRVRDGMPQRTAKLRECNRCGEPVWRSARATDDMYLLCYHCADELMPGWRMG